MKRYFFVLILFSLLSLPSFSTTQDSLFQKILNLSSFEKNAIVFAGFSLWIAHITQPEKDPNINIRIGEQATTLKPTGPLLLLTRIYGPEKDLDANIKIGEQEQ